jgi:hypothetical protein
MMSVCDNALLEEEGAVSIRAAMYKMLPETLLLTSYRSTVPFYCYQVIRLLARVGKTVPCG